MQRRIAEAKRLLANPKVSITDVCFTVGFRDLSYFTRTFQRYVGQPPSRYRLNMGGDATSKPTSMPEEPSRVTNLIFTPRADTSEETLEPYISRS